MFWIFSLLGLLLAGIAYQENVTRYLSFLWSAPFHLVIRISLALAFCLLVFRWFTRRKLPHKALKLIYGILFFPVLLLPFFRCSFRVPFVFCSVCPTKCPWGISRGVMFGSFIFLNIFSSAWCAGYCPLGTYQECQTRISPWHVALPRWAGASAYLALAAVAALYALTVFAPRAAESFMAGYYVWAMATVIAAAVILAAAFFIPRFWCRYLCPVGTIARLSSFRKRSASTG